MGPPLVDADWYAFCQALYKGIGGKDWEEMYDSCKIMSSMDVGVKKPQEAQKARALWAMKSARSCGKNISRIQLLPWTKPQTALKVSTELDRGFVGAK